MTMRVGLLLCDHVPDGLAAYGDYPDMFGSLLADHPAIDLVTHDLTAGGFPGATDECDGWIITGSRRSVYDPEPWIGRLEGLVQTLVTEGRRLVGVCFGHQMIGQALGGRVSRSDRGWGVGVKEIRVTAAQPWMQPPATSYRVLNSHADQIVEAPPGMRILGSNDHCPIALAAVGDHVLGIQGHPEFVPDFARAQMLGRRGGLIPAGVVDQGLASLANAPDRGLLASWIATFLTRGRP